MKFTLKDLHRLENAINQAIEDLLQQTRDNLQLQLTAYDANIGNKIAARQTLVIGNIEDAKALTALRYEIRRRIQTTNGSIGLDELLNRIARIQADIRILNTLGIARRGRIGLGGDIEALTDEMLTALTAKFASIRANPGAAVAREDAVVLPFVLKQDAIDANKTRRAQLGRELEQVKDRIGGLNIGTTVPIEFSAAQSALLKKHNVFIGAEG